MTTQLLNNNENDINIAGKILSDGGLVAIPTETVYGLAADALNGAAVADIFAAKGRPMDNPLIVHIAAFEDISRFSLVREIPEAAYTLAQAFWPGPLTIPTRFRPDTTPWRYVFRRIPWLRRLSARQKLLLRRPRQTFRARQARPQPRTL